MSPSTAVPPIARPADETQAPVAGDETVKAGGVESRRTKRLREVVLPETSVAVTT
jgi:hypothetical protein